MIRRVQTATAAAAAAAAAALAMGSNAAAQTSGAPPPPCATPDHRQMDFWLGVWDVSWEAGGGTPAGRGTNTITRELDGCVIHEAFDGGPATGGLIGRSFSMFHAASGLWRQTWVDNQGGYYALTGGPEGERFVLVSTRISDAAPHQRMVYEDVTENSLTWRWQRSADGGATWADQWVIRYVRRGS